MRKVIAAINMTLDGFCDHTAAIPDEEIHHHYADLLNNAGVILYGRITYQLMQFWQTLLKNPTAIDKIPKIVFSHTLKNTEWDTARLSNLPIEKEVSELKNKPGKDILIGSPSLIIQLTNLNLIDEFQLCVHPVLIGKGLPLFDKIKDRTIFKLLKTKIFGSGAIVHYYEPTRQ